jgi:integrase/recombinase XerD
MSWVKSRKSKNSPSGKHWYYCFRDEGKIVSRKIPDAFTKAQAELIQGEWDQLLSTNPQTIVVRLEELAGALIAQDEQSGLSPQHIDGKKRYFQKSLFPILGRKTPVKDIDVAKVKEWLFHRKKDKGRFSKRISNTTVKHEFYALSSAFELGIERGVLSENPCKKIVLKRILGSEQPRRKEALTLEEIQRLIDCSENHTKLFIQIAACTAARKSEILQLKWVDINFGRKEITFRHDPDNGQRIKSKKTVVLPIGDYLLDALQQWKESSSGVWVFQNPNGRRIYNVKTSFTNAVQRAGLDKSVSPHVLRHSVNTILMELNIPQSDVRDFLRHADFRMTSLYGHSRSDRLRNIADSFNFDACGDTENKTVEQGAPPNAPPTPKMVDLLVKARVVLDALSQEESMGRKVKRETGIEPATLSLEG